MTKSLLRTIALTLAFAVPTIVVAEIPAGYYSGINGKKDAELKTALYNIIHNLTKVSSYNDLPTYFLRTDVQNNSNLWWDMYSNIPRRIPSFSGLNREHSFPKSWWGGTTTINAYVDLNHLYPADGPANMAKSNYPMGELDPAYKPVFDNGMTKVGYPIAGQGGGATQVFEPDNEYKGDFARTYFYMATCYQNLTWKYTYMVNSNTYPTLNTWSINLLLKWHRGDPVSQKEIDRNEQVYAIQNNRNPFIDYPQLVEYIWGNRVGDAFNAAQSTTPTGTANLIAPVKGISLDFPDVAIGKSATAQLFFRGENITGSLDVAIAGTDRSLFKAATTKIPAEWVNTPEGFWLTVTYTPTSEGEHTARLVVSEGGITGSRAVTLIAHAFATPTLSPCVALEASDITSDSYTANWSVPENDVVDYFIVNRTKYVNGTVTTEQIEADIDNRSLEITGFNESDSETYTVQSVRLGYYSDPSNVITVSHAGVSDVTLDQPFAVVGLDGAIRILCSSAHTGVRVYDIAGRLVQAIPEIVNNAIIPMGRGAYIITTDQNPAPHKVVVK